MSEHRQDNARAAALMTMDVLRQRFIDEHGGFHGGDAKADDLLRKAIQRAELGALNEDEARILWEYVWFLETFIHYEIPKATDAGVSCGWHPQGMIISNGRLPSEFERP